MAGWETEAEDDLSGPTAVSRLPTPTEAPYRTPSRGSRRSNRSRRSVTPPGKMSSSPPPMPGSDKTDKSARQLAMDVANDDKISILDPRRFTPTLHANLVSEILTLRRDQEEKIKLIENLESTLHTTREEEDQIQETLLSTAKENRSLKRQLALLEGGTASALSELDRQRDEANDLAAESKKRSDAAQKKLRALEDDMQRTHNQFGKEKEAWENEKRNLERKLHVAETRLKQGLDEMLAFQAAHVNGQQAHDAESDGEDKTKESDNGSVRSMSMTNSVRFSVMSKPMNGHSLADELNFDDDSDYQTDPNGRDSVMSNYRNVRSDSRNSIMTPSSKTHRRHCSGESLMRSGSVKRNRFQSQMQLDGSLANGIIQEDEEPPTPRKVSYTDTGVQYSPPPSPKLAPRKPSTPEPPMLASIIARFEKPQEPETNHEANQRRKRVSIAAKPLVIQRPSVENLMVSASAQTVDVPLSPPRTPKSPPLQEMPPSPIPKPVAETISTATQTDIPTVSQLPQLASTTPSFLPVIPSISIHPPTSRPTTPREPRLPQLSKDFGCQVSIQASIPYSSIATQTEEIRIDQRLDRLPAHLHPSAVTSRPVSPAESQIIRTDPDRHFTPLPGNLPPRNPRRLASQSSLKGGLPVSPRPSDEPETRDSYPGNNDDGALSQHKAPMRRPHRMSSLFAGFDNGGSSDEVDDFADVDMSDSEYRTALSAPKPLRSPDSNNPSSPEEYMPRRFSRPTRPFGVSSEPGTSSISEASGRGRGRELPFPVRRTSSKGPPKSAAINAANKSTNALRKAAMIQSGIATHQELPEATNPPFPIPTRASSRVPPFTVSAPSDGGNRSPTRNEPWHRRGMRNSTHQRANSIRKVRSAAAMPPGSKGKYKRNGSRSPPPPMSPNEGPRTPSYIPPMPRNDLATPKNERGRKKGHHPQPSVNTAITDMTGDASQSSSQQAATGVVDAIAQTMVGEWMFKYVRRRKSFGIASENVGKDDSSNDRHKRWVWLAPYERAILWSSKQPSSGSALLGKSGRKLVIQSVLDVKDDNPAPKGGPPVFNRSILILTPQRALKFTAVNAERHYLWLTSLSFLAHSQQAVPEIPTNTTPPQQRQRQRQAITPDFELPKSKTRRPGIRDSIRLAKGRNLNSLAAPGGQITVKTSSSDIMPMPSIPDMPSNLSNHRGTPSPAPDSVTSSSNPRHSHIREESGEAAEPPFIPRFHDRNSGMAVVHGRKRSNTGGHVPPPLSFRGFSSPEQQQRAQGHVPSNSTSTGTGGSSDIYAASNPSSHNQLGLGPGNAQGPGPGPGPGSVWGGMSERTSEASNRTSGNFFDAIGTMRMEAFISPLVFGAFDGPEAQQTVVEERRDRARRRSKEIRRKKSRSRSRQRDGYASSRGAKTDAEYYTQGGGNKIGGDEDFFRADDPFKGF